MNTGTDILVMVLGVCMSLLIFIILMMKFITCVYLPFAKKRDFIKMEMARSFKEEEYLYWKKELKILYISKIPIVGCYVQGLAEIKMKRRQEECIDTNT